MEIRSIEVDGAPNGSAGQALLAAPISAMITSSDPNFWLPPSACQAFEQAFGLILDKSTGLYLINSTQYATLQAANPVVSIALASDLEPDQSVVITLPFSAFALQASYPFTPNTTYYFPLRQADTTAQYTLGIAFLQEAYLTVDYERGNFSVSQCTFNQTAAQALTAILSPTYGAQVNFSVSPASPKAAHQMKLGVIIGTVFGVIGLAGMVFAVGYYFYHKKHDKISLDPVEENAFRPIEALKDDKDTQKTEIILPLSSPNPHPGTPFDVEKSAAGFHERDLDDPAASDLDATDPLSSGDSQRQILRFQFSPNSNTGPSENSFPVYQQVVYEMPGVEIPKAELDGQNERRFTLAPAPGRLVIPRERPTTTGSEDQSPTSGGFFGR